MPRHRPDTLALLAALFLAVRQWHELASQRVVETVE
jgi:hypothetical protein